MPHALFAVCSITLFVLTSATDCRAAGTNIAGRLTRGNLEEYIGDKSNPNFWPVRGRREIKDVGRKFGREEETGVFWAGRGRGLDYGDKAWQSNELRDGWKTKEEPLWMNRRDDDILCSSGVLKDTGNVKRESDWRKMCYLKRKSNNVLRELPQAEHFYPVRGKKSRNEAWQEIAKKLAALWPVRRRFEYDKLLPKFVPAPVT